MPLATGREAAGNSYWSARRHLRYYEVVRRCLEEAGPGRILIDVGSQETPVVTFGRFARRIAIDLQRCGEYPGVEAHKADWMEFELGERASVITCLQVLEHLCDAAAGPFARKLLSSAEVVIVSVPYLWPAGQDADHLQDPMDEAKLATIMGREPSASAVVAEHPSQLSHRRLVAVYRQPAAHGPSVHAVSSDLAVAPAPSTAIRTVGWTLGNDCPYQCKHCYSFTVRRKGRNMERWMVDRIVHQLAENRISSVNLGGNEPRRLSEAIHLIEQLLGRKAEYRKFPFHKTDVRATWADISEARKTLGWKPKVKLEEGIRRTVGWHRQNSNLARAIALR